MSSSPSYSSNSLPSVLINFILHCFISLEKIVYLFRIRMQCISVHVIVTSSSNNRLKVNCSCNFTTNMISLFSHNNRLTNISLSLIELSIKSKKMLGTGLEFIIWSLEIIRWPKQSVDHLSKKFLLSKILIFFTCVQVKVKIINFTFLEFNFWLRTTVLLSKTIILWMKQNLTNQQRKLQHDHMYHVLEHNNLNIRNVMQTRVIPWL